MKPFILATGFGPFPGVEVNPTQALVEQLAGGEFADFEISCRVLDVSFQRSQEQLQEQLQQSRPRCLVHFGVASGADRLRVETQAVNRKSTNIPDVDGRQFEACPVHPSRELDAVLTTPLPAQQLVDSLNDAGWPARVSDDAGRYVCNSIYFHSLALSQEQGGGVPVVFVHVPLVGADPSPADPRDTSWTRQRLLLAAQHVVLWLADRIPEAG